MCNYLSTFFEIVFAVFPVLKFGLVSWQLNGKVKVWDSLRQLCVLLSCTRYGDNYLLSRIACWHQTPHASYLGSASDARHVVYPTHRRRPTAPIDATLGSKE